MGGSLSECCNEDIVMNDGIKYCSACNKEQTSDMDKWKAVQEMLDQQKIEMLIQQKMLYQQQYNHYQKQNSPNTLNPDALKSIQAPDGTYPF